MDHKREHLTPPTSKGHGRWEWVDNNNNMSPSNCSKSALTPTPDASLVSPIATSERGCASRVDNNSSIIKGSLCIIDCIRHLNSPGEFLALSFRFCCRVERTKYIRGIGNEMMIQMYNSQEFLR